MKVVYPVLAVLFLACGACSSTPPARLTQDARLEVDPNKPPADLKVTQIKPADWPQEAAELCARPGYQCVTDVITVSLTKRDGSNYHMAMQPPTPVIQDNKIFVFAGQAMYIEADRAPDGSLSNLHLVKEIVHPEKTVSITFTQEAKTPGGVGMMLVIHNPFDQPLKYSAGMMSLDGSDGAIYATDTCPIIAKINGVELWPMPIFQVVLSNLHTLDPKAEMSCSY